MLSPQAGSTSQDGLHDGARPDSRVLRHYLPGWDEQLLPLAAQAQPPLAGCAIFKVTGAEATGGRRLSMDSITLAKARPAGLSISEVR